jgi:peptidoglycan/LPS O-acetylase OafA/YrhL
MLTIENNINPSVSFKKLSSLSLSLSLSANKLKTLFKSLFSFVSPKDHAEVSKHYRPDIDGLRAFAVLSVVGYHFFPNLIKSGFVGVDIFFVISGYLIGGILLDRLNASKGENTDKPISLATRSDAAFSNDQDEQTLSVNNNSETINAAHTNEVRFIPYLLDFYKRRVLRILPALIVVMIACLAFGWFALLPDDYETLGKHILGGSTFVSNIILCFEAGYWDSESHRKILLHLWSLGVEEQYYLVFPIMVFILFRSRLRKNSFYLFAIILSLALNLYFYKADKTLDFYMLFTRFWELLAGSLLALEQRRGAAWIDKASIKLNAFINFILFERGQSKSDMALVKHLLSLLGLIAMIASTFALKESKFPGGYALAPVLGAVMLIAAGSHGVFNRFALSWKPIVFIGLISYPLYLWHWAILSYLKIIIGNDLSDLAWLKALAILVSIALSILTYYLIERPIRFGKGKRGLKAIALLVVLAVVGGVGAALYIKGAPQDRWLTMTKSEYVNSSPENSPWGNANLSVPLCRKRYMFEQDACFYNYIGAEETVLIIGDSNTITMFNATVKYNQDRGVNTLSFGRWYINNPITSDDINYRSLIVETINNDNSIKRIYITILALQYIDIMGAQEFKRRLQSFVNEIKAPNRKIYIVENHPFLAATIKDYIAHPLNIFTSKRPFLSTRQYMLEKSKEFYAVVNSVDGLTLIPSLNAWCPINKCLLTDENGRWLYIDDHHLTAGAGGRFLVDKVLQPYLEE